MMKGFRSFIPALTLAGALLAGSLPASVGAQGTRAFSSGFQVQNLSSSTATLSIAFYPEGSGTAGATISDQITPEEGSVTYATLPDAVADGFKGSAVISSDQPVAAIVNLLSPNLTSLVSGGPTGRGVPGTIGEAYVGVTEGSRTVALPLLFKNYFGFSTFFSVQNVGQTETGITITYSGGGLSAPVSETSTIPPRASVRFDQSASSQLPNNFNGSAVITADASDIAAVVTQFGTSTALVYNGFAGGSTEPVFPLINANNFGFITGISLQNIGTAATTVTVSYTPSAAGTACEETLEIPGNGGTAFFALEAFNNGPTTSEDCAQGAFVGSAQVTNNSANQPLVGIVNQLNQGTSKGGSYSSFDAAAATNTVVYPLMQDRVSDFFTGLSIVNVGSTSTAITCRFSGTTATQSSDGDIAPGGTFTVVQLNEIANNYTGSATCTGAEGAQLVGIANQLRNNSPVDAFFVYEGANN